MPPLPFNYVIGLLRAGGGAAGMTVTPVIAASLTSGVAPFGVVFDGVQTTCSDGLIAPFHDLIYFFDYGDGAAATYTYGQLAGQTKNKFLGGPVAAYVYETPGSYTARMWVSDGVSVWGPVSQAITATDPDTVYSSANTYYFHPTVTPVPGVDGVPAGATVGNCFTQANFTTIVQTYIATGRRIRLRAGQEYQAGGSGVKNNLQNVTLDTYGSGTQAIVKGTANGITVLQPNPNTTANNPNGWRLNNIHFTRDITNDCTFTGSIAGTVLTVSAVATGAIAVGQRLHYTGMAGSVTVSSFGTGSGGTGTYNISSSVTLSSTNMAATLIAPNAFIYGVSAEVALTRQFVKGNLTMHNCKFSYLTSSALNVSGKGVVMSKCVVDGMGTGAAYLSGANGAYLSSLLNSAIIDSFIDNKNSGEHCMRVQGADYFAIISNEMRNPGSSKSLLTVRGWSNIQVSDQTISMVYVNVARNYINNTTGTGSSPWPSQLAPQNGSSKENITDAIWDSNFYRLNASPVLALHALARNVSVRNNIVNTASTANFVPWSVYNDNSAGVNTPQYVNIYNNTCYAPSANQFSTLVTTAGTSLTTLANNVSYAPVATLGGDNSGPPSVVTSSSGGTSTTLSNNSTAGQITGTDPLFVGPTTTQAGFALQSGSPYKNAAINYKVRVDALGKLRVGATFDAGAANAPDKQVDAWTLIP